MAWRGNSHCQVHSEILHYFSSLVGGVNFLDQFSAQRSVVTGQHWIVIVNDAIEQAASEDSQIERLVIRSIVVESGDQSGVVAIGVNPQVVFAMSSYKVANSAVMLVSRFLRGGKRGHDNTFRD